MLNDRDTGHVWDIDSDKPTRLDNWDAFNLESKDEDDDDDDDRQNQGDRRPPKAEKDNLGARPGRTTILHPLDNDTAPSGRLLAIRSVRDATGGRARSSRSAPTARPSRSPCRATPRASTSFEYFIDDGRAVRVRPRHRPREHRGRRPVQRRAAAARWASSRGSGPSPPVARIDVPVLPDWRDPEDGDPVSHRRPPSSSAAGRRPAQSRVTASGGRCGSCAPRQGGLVQVEYGVTDGLGDPVTETLDFRVQEPDDLEPVAPHGRAGRDRRRDRQADHDQAARQRPARVRPRTPPTPCWRSAGKVRQRARRRGDHQPGQGHHHLALGDGADLLPRLPGGLRHRRHRHRQDPRRRARPREPAPRPGRGARHASRCSARRPRSSTCWPTTSTRRADCCRCSAPTPLADNQLDVAIVDGPLAADLGPAGPARAQPPDRPLHDQQRLRARASRARWWSASGRHRRTTPRSPRTTR